MRRLALSRDGAKDFVKGTFATLLLDFGLMLPAVYAFLFLDENLRPLTGHAGVAHNDVWYYIGIAVLFIIVIWIIAKIQYRSTYISIYAESANRRLALAEKLRKLPLSFYGKKNLSDLTSTIMQDNTYLEHTFSHAVPQLFASVIFLTIIGIMLFVYNWMLTLALFWAAPVALAVLLLSKKIQHRNHKKIYDKNRDISEHIQEGLDTIQEIKAYSNEGKYIHDLTKKLDDYEKNLIHGELLLGILVNSAKGILKLGLVTVILVGANLLVAGDVNLFTYLVFLILAAHIFEPINEVFNNLAALFMLDVRINRMKEMEALPIHTGMTEFTPENFDIVFEDVGFSYETGKQVLRNVSFTAKQGEITALVGPSGGGKSTSAKLAARFWDVNSGRILLGNQDISEIDPETLLKYYSVVFQDVILFNTSVIENIRIGRHGASDKEVLRVATLAQCDDFVSKLPDGYQTFIGENGEKLSGGERQRISIARALLKDAPIVLLDEATASLDVENETRIQAGISELVRNKTVLIIAHRMRTVTTADKIVVLENGMVKESGRPEDLKSSNGTFSTMVRRQMKMTAGDVVG